jgi:hypothetical protein
MSESISRNGDATVSLAILAEVASTWRVEYQDSSTDSTWRRLTAVRFDQPATLRVQDFVAPSRVRLYRLVRED